MKTLVTFFLSLLSSSLLAQAWQKMADVPVELAFPVVAELRGNIHVMGGGAPAGATDLHLRYQPALNKWDTLAPIPYKAQQPAGAVLRGNIHYFGGGYPNSGSRLDKHYYYNPDSNKWYAAAVLPVATAIHEAVSANGKLYCLSGQPNKTLCQYYDPDSNKWFQKNALPDQNFWYGAIVSVNHVIYRFGGGGFTAPTAACHKYNASADNWTNLTDLPNGLHAVAGTAMGDSAIYLSGGYYNGAEQKSTWIYDIKKNTYYVGEPYESGRNYHSLVTIGNCIYSVGGNNDLYPNTGVSLLKYCPPAFPLNVIEPESEKLYTVVKTPALLKITFNHILANPMDIFVYDSKGTLVNHQSSYLQTDFELSGENLPQALYIIRVQSGAKVFTEKWLSGN